MFFFFFFSSVYSTVEVTGVQTGPVSVGNESDYNIYDCFMEEIKNSNGFCQALYFVGANANYEYNLNVERTVFSNCSAEYGSVLVNENLNLVVVFNKVCISHCSASKSQGAICSKSTQYRAQPKLEYISIHSCKSPQATIYFKSSNIMDNQWDLYLTHSNYSNCAVTNDKENGFSFLYFRKNFQYNTIESNSVSKYLIYYLDVNSDNYSNSIKNCNFISNKAPFGILSIDGFPTTVEYCVFKYNSGYCFDTSRNKIDVYDSYFDNSATISWTGDPVSLVRNVYTSTNHPTYNFDLYSTYNCFTIPPRTLPPNTPQPTGITPCITPINTPNTTPFLTPYQTPSQTSQTSSNLPTQTHSPSKIHTSQPQKPYFNYKIHPNRF